MNGTRIKLPYPSALFIFAGLLLCISSIDAQKQTYAVASIGFYNLENLFDTEDDPFINDEEFLPEGPKLWTPERYQYKLANMASVIGILGKDINPEGVAILGVAEIENRKVLEDLINQDAMADRDWAIVHYDSPDNRGVDVGMIYQPRFFSVLESRSINLPIIEDDGTRRNTRDILYVKGLLFGDTTIIMVNHWPSRRGGEKATRKFRMEGAAICKRVIDSVLAVSPDTRAVIMGDLNDDPVSPSVKKVLMAQGTREDVSRNGYFNPMLSKYKSGEGSNAYRDAWSLFDQIILTGNTVKDPGEAWQYFRAEIHKTPDMLQRTGRFKGYPFRTFAGDQFLGGYSDHFPVVVHLIRPI